MVDKLTCTSDILNLSYHSTLKYRLVQRLGKKEATNKDLIDQ